MEWLVDIPGALVIISIIIMLGLYLIVDRKCDMVEKIEAMWYQVVQEEETE